MNVCAIWGGEFHSLVGDVNNLRTRRADFHSYETELQTWEVIHALVYDLYRNAAGSNSNV